jgi:hypothetical protein
MAHSAKVILTAALPALLALLALGGCGGKPAVKQEFRADTPHSQRVTGPGEAVCWAVKRAFLTQGYMLERGSDTLVMSGYKDSQSDEETNVTQRMQATCVDNRDGTSTVFATASREVSKLQKVGYSTTTGISIFTLSLPSGSDKSLRVQSRETIQDPKFYQGFYALVQQFANEDIAQGRKAPPAQARRDDVPPQARREEEPLPRHPSDSPPRR